MNTPAFSKPTRRFLAIALPVLVLLLVGVFVVGPIVAIERDLAQQVRQLRLTAAKVKSSADALPALKEAVAKARQDGGSAKVSTAATLALGAAELQSSVRAIISAQAGRTSSIETLDAEDASGLSRVVVRVQGTVPASNLAQLLFALETADPGILISDLTLASRNAQRARVPSQSAVTEQIAFVLTAHRIYEIGSGR